MTVSAREEWGDFPCTHLYFAGAPDLVVDVQERVSEDARTALAARGLTASFAVITAQDPMGETQRRDVNAQLAIKLQEHVATLGVPYVRVDACNPDRSHCEESVAVVLARAEAVRLACAYDQLAIFWFDGDAFWILPARSRRAAVRLASA